MINSNKPAHVPECRHYPIRTAHSPDGPGTDHLLKTWPEALEYALKRAPARGRQVVRQHSGWLLKRVWVVQDKRSS